MPLVADLIERAKALEIGSGQEREGIEELERAEAEVGTETPAGDGLPAGPER